MSAMEKVDVIHFDAEVAKLLDTRVEDPSVMLGIVYVDTDTTLQLNMRFQIDAVLERYGMIDCNVKKTPLPVALQLSPASADLQTAESKAYPYPEVVGSLLWIVRCTLVTAKFACNVLCGHMSSWDSTHVAAAVRSSYAQILEVHERPRGRDSAHSEQNSNHQNSIDYPFEFSVMLTLRETQLECDQHQLSPFW